MEDGETLQTATIAAQPANGFATIAMNAEQKMADSVLRERVKELECFYAIAQVSAIPEYSAAEVLEHIANLLPAAWRFPERVCARIEFDTLRLCSHADRPMAENSPQQEAAIAVRGVVRGKVAVGYPPGDFAQRQNLLLAEEQRLLNEVARKIADVVERMEERQAHEALQKQLRHADRLATIGQLASGIAHELNEPLGGILGFAQLLAKTPRLPRAARDDAVKIEAAALHARDIIRKLMVFARQSPPQLKKIHLDRLIEKSVSLWAWRCEDAGVRVTYALEPDLPSFPGDEGQIVQVMVNLVVNAVQAMPEGGCLTLATARSRSWVELSVADTGVGLSADVQKKMFDPFFTTKDVNQGTGLGLSVVHGIVTAHGGKIFVESKLGRGTRVRARFPRDLGWARSFTGGDDAHG